MTEQHNGFTVKFWGVRGSIPCPGAETVRYGGNTPCVEMRVGSERLIFDGGTGLRVLGQALMKEMPLMAHLFFTHTHWDHIQGFPFFTPAFIPGNTFHIYGAKSPKGATIKQRHHDQMLHPNFPVPLQVMQAELHFHDLHYGQQLSLGDIIVENAKLNHPGEAAGYRVTWRGVSVAYITDTEHHADHLDENVLHLARNADLLIIDACYTDEEYYDAIAGKQGWGHSTWQECVKVAHASGAKSLALFHHDPLHTDGFLDEIARQAHVAFSGCFVAREGQAIEFPTTPLANANHHQSTGAIATPRQPSESSP